MLVDGGRRLRREIDPEVLLRVEGLRVSYPIREPGGGLRRLRAVDNVSFSVARGEVLALVGETGCGKTTTGQSVLRLIDPDQGRIWMHGRDITRLRRSELKSFRASAQMVFQDPYASLDPRMTFGEIIAEPLAAHYMVDAAAVRPRVAELLEIVGLSPRFAHRYPHEFSGGQRQRVAIARAIALEPELLVADEPLTALDVSVQAQILVLLNNLQRDFNLSMIFIAHDLATVRQVANRIAVMYLGRIMELAPTEDIMRKPLHPYTRALLSAVPVPDPVRQRSRKRLSLYGEPPSAHSPPTGCPFHPRCPEVTELCTRQLPVLSELRAGHQVACHHTEVSAAEMSGASWPVWRPRKR